MATKKTLEDRQQDANDQLIQHVKRLGVNTGDLPIVVDGESALNLVERINGILAKLNPPKSTTRKKSGD